MKNSFICMLLFCFSFMLGCTDNSEYSGIYESMFLEDMFEDQDIPEQIRNVQEKAEIQIQIDKGKISVKLPDGELFSEEYIVQGNVIIAKTKFAGKDMVYTFYIGDDDILYGIGQRFKKRK